MLVSLMSLCLQTGTVPGEHDAIVATLAANVHSLTVGPGIGGPGGELLLREAEAASFLCLGESHLTNETPALTAAMLPALRERGYSAFAIETGERIAERVESALATGRDEDAKALADLFVRMPFTAAFVDHVPEFELMRDAARGGYDLWGLDQVFIGGARFNLSELVVLAPDERARELAETARAKAQAGLEHAMQTGDQSAAYLLTTTPDEYATLRTAFAGVDEAIRIIDELEVSGRIYGLYGAGENYQSNKMRIDLMKRHLAEHVRALPAGARVLMKFGSIHMGRGYTTLNQLDLGNAAGELGVLRGDGSLHVHVMATGRRRPDGTFVDFATASPDLATLIGARDAAGAGDGPVVIDLRPLRPIVHDEERAVGHEEIAKLAWRYDLVVLAKEYTAASPLPGVPSLPVR